MDSWITWWTNVQHRITNVKCQIFIKNIRNSYRSVWFLHSVVFLFSMYDVWFIMYNNGFWPSDILKITRNQKYGSFSTVILFIHIMLKHQLIITNKTHSIVYNIWCTLSAYLIVLVWLMTSMNYTNQSFLTIKTQSN